MIWFTNPEVTVACVYRSGGPYGPDDVRILRNQVQRNLTVPHEFVCISDETVAGVSCIPMAYGLPGKWSKMELWRPYIPWTGSRILYLDLDAVIQNHIDSLIKKAPVTFRQPSPEYKTRRTEEGLQRIRRYSSAVMCIEPHSRPEVWDNFVTATAKNVDEPAAEQSGDEYDQKLDAEESMTLGIEILDQTLGDGHLLFNVTTT